MLHWKIAADKFPDALTVLPLTLRLFIETDGAAKETSANAKNPATTIKKENNMPRVRALFIPKSI
jgi:hypothetical protein